MDKDQTLDLTAVKKVWSWDRSMSQLFGGFGWLIGSLWIFAVCGGLCALVVGLISFRDGFVIAPPFLLSQNIFPLIGSGLVFAFFAASLAVPLSLATALVLAYRRHSCWARVSIQFFKGLSFLPSIVYGFVFCWAAGPFLQNYFLGSWLYFFRSEGLPSQLLAFAFTLVGYPLTIFSAQSVTIDGFYRLSLMTIVDFSQGSYSAVVIILSLVFFLVPIFVSLFFRFFTGTRKNRVQEAALALGASPWEGLQLSVSHSMKTDLRGVFFFGMGKAFVEGVSIFIVLNYFFISGNWQNFFWAETFSAFLLKSLLFHSLTWADYLSMAVLLLIFHGGLSYLSKNLKLTFDEELMR